jgi:NhaP-type Na+/H+ or K+/H+ antiporter
VLTDGDIWYFIVGCSLGLVVGLCLGIVAVIMADPRE